MQPLDPTAYPLPDRSDEAWRFTPFNRIAAALEAAPDGKVVVEHTAPAGVTVTTVDRSDDRFGALLQPTDRWTAEAMAGFERGTAVTIPRGFVGEEPIVLTIRGEGGRAYGHLLVDVEPEAEAIVVVDHSGTATFLANAEIRVGQGARLTFVSLQDWAPGSIHLGTHVAEVGRDAHFTSIIATLGGDLVRLVPQVRFSGSGGEAELLGLFFADGGQHLEHRLFIDHNQPHCRSRVTYKGALQGEDAHSVWVGDVFIRANAVGTDTYEVNRNLILNDGARADSIPNLEIETGEVMGAGHASATGRFDDLQLFYLQSRGIAADEARRLVVRGFFAEVLERIAVPDLRARLASELEAEIDRAVL